MNFLSKEHRGFLIFITLVAVLRLLIAPYVGLGVDEAHYVLYAIHLDWSYFDHPPLVGWTQYFFTSIFGVNEFGARVSAVLIGFFTSIFLYQLLYQIDKNANKAFLAVLSLYASFIFNALFLMLMPDTLLFLFMIPIILSVIKLEENNSLKNWLTLGVLLGLAGLSKYTAVLFVLPIIAYFIIKKRYALFISPKILLTIVVALLIISPVIYWNILHDWISFSYQSSHVVGSKSIHWLGFFRSLGAQFGAYNPLLLPLAFYGLYKAFRSQNNTLFLSALFGLTLIAFFTYASLYKTALPHWSALFYMLFIPIGTYYMLNVSKKYVKIAIAFGLLLSALAYAELVLKFIPFPDYQSIHRDIYGWDTIIKKANAAIKDPNKEAIAVTNWTLASRAMYYNNPYKTKVYLIDKRQDQFDLWEDKNKVGKDLVIIQTKFFHKNLEKYMKCDKIEPLKKFDIMLHKHKVNTIDLVMCRNFQGLQ
ncbi:glycosyltransferase family 39 protein [Sulfurimonas sp.]|uniref:ArnT family glycosyltransferase n=1 Tax=Sulfurimonas sp. TaxID=2022749 RepID=UPI00261D7566|nr:glycosyltransferase family 39 protein [Sulfurimonas sp.]